MPQYRIGTVQMTQGSTTVTAVDPDAPDVMAETAWLTEVTAGDYFYAAEDATAYTVASITSDTELQLTGAYQGPTTTPAGTPLRGVEYAIHRDFSVNYGLPIPSRGDIGVSVFMQQAIIDIDAALAALDTRVTAMGG